MCMKQPNFIMSLLKPSPDAPENNIDVYYLEPSLEELKTLWEVGVEMDQENKLLICGQYYCGLSVIFLYMQTYQDGAQKENWPVHLVTRTLALCG